MCLAGRERILSLLFSLDVCKVFAQVNNVRFSLARQRSQYIGYTIVPRIPGYNRNGTRLIVMAAKMKKVNKIYLFDK